MFIFFYTFAAVYYGLKVGIQPVVFQLQVFVLLMIGKFINRSGGATTWGGFCVRGDCCGGEGVGYWAVVQ